MFTHQISKPDEPSRYRYVLILIIVIIVVAIISRDFKINHQQIRLRMLIVYIAIILGLFVLMMKWHAEAIANIENDEQLTAEDKHAKIRKLDHVWSLCHFGFYLGLGILMPNNWTLILTLQIVWELFEDFMGYKLKRKQYIETDGKKMSDIILNSAGYFLGNLISKRLFARQKAFQFSTR